MPALLAHDFFGRDAFGAVMKTNHMYTPDEKNAFLLGCQGPDTLYYLVLLPPLEPFRQLAQRMHNEGPSSLLVAMRMATDALSVEDKPVGRAYLAGFVCHYLLDREVNPLIYYWERGICQAGVPDLDVTSATAVHAEIGRDLDEMVLYAKREETILTYKPHEEVLRARELVTHIIGRLYYSAVVSSVAQGEPTAVGIYPVALACHRRATALLYSPKSTKASVMGGLEKRLFRKKYATSKAMAYKVRAQSTSVYDNREHRPWNNPFTGEVKSESFWDLYDSALMQAPSAVAMVFSAEFNRACATALTHGLNFSGEPVE